jgi:hypothetical protein
VEWVEIRCDYIGKEKILLILLNAGADFNRCYQVGTILYSDYIFGWCFFFIVVLGTWYTRLSRCQQGVSLLHRLRSDPKIPRNEIQCLVKSWLSSVYIVCLWLHPFYWVCALLSQLVCCSSVFAFLTFSYHLPHITAILTNTPTVLIGCELIFTRIIIRVTTGTSPPY